MDTDNPKSFVGIGRKVVLTVCGIAAAVALISVGLLYLRFYSNSGGNAYPVTFKPLVIYILAIIAFFAGVTLFVGLYLIKGLLNAFGKLKAATERIADGELDHRIDLGTKDEIEELGAFFNEMASQLQASRETIKDYLAEKDQINVNLWKMTEDLSRANAELNVYKQEMEEKVKDRTKDLSETQLAILNMLEDLKESKDEIENTNTNLVQAYRQLKETQDSLVQAEKMAALGRFSAGVAHQVKNPLAVSLGGLEYLEKKLVAADSDVQESIIKIKEAILRADNVLRDLMQFARPSKLELEVLNPNDLVREIATLFKYKSPLDINIELALEEKEMYIKVDKNQIQQVVLDILMNSSEAMPKGGKITVKTCFKAPLNQSQGENPSCVIEVDDTGEGISGDVLPRIFEPFFTTKGERKGTGLGLAMAKAIIDKHKGELVFQSQEGKGTAVKIILPIVSKEQEEGIL